MPSESPDTPVSPTCSFVQELIKLVSYERLCKNLLLPYHYLDGLQVINYPVAEDLFKGSQHNGYQTHRSIACIVISVPAFINRHECPSRPVRG